MIIKKTPLAGLYTIENIKREDKRGYFVKTFHSEIFIAAGLEAEFKESYYSLSHKNVLRGMHFQLPPDDHNKLVYVIKGEILDVGLDIRKESFTYGKHFSVLLSESSNRAVYLSKGLSHGFLTLSEEAIVVYMTSTVYAPDSDKGILWSSFGFDWGIVNPIISDRDSNLTKFDQF